MDNLKADVWRWRAAANSCLILWYVSAHSVIKPATTLTQKTMTNILKHPWTNIRNIFPAVFHCIYYFTTLKLHMKTCSKKK